MTRLVSALDQVLAEKALAGRPTDRRWRGSLLGGCLRQSWYAAEKVPPSNPPDARALRLFERGHLTARVLTEHLRQGRDVLFAVEEVHVTDDAADLAVNVDLFVRWREGFPRYTCFEIKSVNGQGMRYVAQAPKPDHAIQCIAGTILLEQEMDCPVEARLVYISADDWRITEHVVGSEWRDIYRRVLRALAYFGDRKPPRLRRARTEYPCAWCPYRDICKPEGE